ncbi:MAG: FAD-binding protein [Pseudomonadales bacterium]|nr:FAD-binding protein [Pseudomonadales bacterium]
MINRRQFLASSALTAIYARTFAATSTETPGTTPWSNWSGGQTANPAGRFSPSSETDLVQFLQATTGAIRPVGAGHSFTPLVPTDGHLIVIDQLSGVLDDSREAMTATLGAGTRLSDIGPALEERGQAMLNLPDIDRQTLAGATATATHGTGISFPSLSGFVESLRLITPAGDILDFSATDDELNAARVSLGALGVVTQMTLKNRPPYRLRARNTVEKIESVLERFDTAAANHRHFEMFPLTHSDYALVLEIDETNADINNPPPAPEEAAAFGQAMAGWAATPPKDRQPLVDGLAEQIQPTEAVDTSYKILSNVRNNRFNEMEYSVPLHAGADCLREILRTIKEKEIDVVFPLEYRYVQRDDTWIGMSTGDEDHAAISIHRTASEDYRPYFDLIEPIFWKYGGRPHWGKIHSLSASELTKLYPRFGDFQALRKRLDPAGRLLNNHLRKILSV